MEWIKLLIEFIKVIAWPVISLVIAFFFKNQLSDLLKRITKAKLPGGFEFELEKLKKKLEKEAPELSSSSLRPHILVAKLEKSLIKLAQHSLGTDIGLRNYERMTMLSNLELKNIISSTEAKNAKLLFSILDGLSVTEADEKEIEEATLAVSLAVSRFEEIYNYEVLRYEFQANGIWHFHETDGNVTFDEKYHFWSTIAAKAPVFNYSYEALVRAAESHNKVDKRFGIYIPSLSDYIEILHFRKNELKRYINDYQNVNNWEWPKDWGAISWNGPIVRGGGANKALREIIDTDLAINFYSGKIAEQRH